MIRPLGLLAAASLALVLPSAADATPLSAGVEAPATVAQPAAATARPAGSYAVRVLSVYDGDTIRISYRGKSERVRLIGLDAPELSPRECYGQQAASRMQSLAQSRTVYIKADGSQGNRDTYGRLLRHVYSASGTSLARSMIYGGHAREYTYNRPYAGQYSHRKAQASAKAARRGLWGSCVSSRPKTPTTTSTCVIKGNITSDGEKIYHVPGGRYYAVTKIDTRKGERWFCTESQAVNAGWRKSKR